MSVRLVIAILVAGLTTVVVRAVGLETPTDIVIVVRLVIATVVRVLSVINAITTIIIAARSSLGTAGDIVVV